MKIKHTLTAGIVAFGAAVMFASTAHAQPPQYIVYDLGALGPDGAFSYGAGLNEAGQITGYSYLSGNNKEGPHAFLYANSSMHDLGTLGGATSSGKVVNNVGQIAGTSGTTDGNNAFLSANGTMNSLGTLGGNSSFGEGLNDIGQVTGFSYITGDGIYHAFLYSGGGMTDLGTLGGTHSVGQDINSAGQVTGYSTTANTGYHAFLYSNGSMMDLGTLSGDNSFGVAINSSGQVAGSSWLAGNGSTHAFFYSDGMMRDLGTLGGPDSNGYGINDDGQVVGNSYTGSAYHAFLTFGNKMYDLNGLVTNLASSGFSYLDTANDINNKGWIVGCGETTDGITHAFLAQVIPEPLTAGLLGLSALLLAACRRRSA